MPSSFPFLVFLHKKEINVPKDKNKFITCVFFISLHSLLPQKKTQPIGCVCRGWLGVTLRSYTQV